MQILRKKYTRNALVRVYSSFVTRLHFVVAVRWGCTKGCFFGQRLGCPRWRVPSGSFPTVSGRILPLSGVGGRHRWADLAEHGLPRPSWGLVLPRPHPGRCLRPVEDAWCSRPLGVGGRLPGPWWESVGAVCEEGLARRGRRRRWEVPPAHRAPVRGARGARRPEGGHQRALPTMARPRTPRPPPPVLLLLLLPPLPLLPGAGECRLWVHRAQYGQGVRGSGGDRVGRVPVTATQRAQTPHYHLVPGICPSEPGELDKGARGAGRSGFHA